MSVDFVAGLALFAAILVAFRCHRLEKRVKLLEEPTRQKRQAETLIAKAEKYRN
jgi:hypothetical protein